MRQSTVLLLIGCATLATLIETSVAETLCPHCVCLPSYSPVCGRSQETGKLRGFSSRCVLECTNKCRKIKYEFFFNGRCGKAPTTTPAPTTASTTTAEPPVVAAQLVDDYTKQPESVVEFMPMEVEGDSSRRR